MLNILNCEHSGEAFIKKSNIDARDRNIDVQLHKNRVSDVITKRLHCKIMKTFQIAAGALM